MYKVALGIFAYGWGDAGDIELNRRKRTYLGLGEEEEDVLKTPVLDIIAGILSIRVKTDIDVRLYLDYLYSKFYKSSMWDEHLEEDSLKNKLPTLSKNIFKDNPMLPERIGMMDEYVELRVYEQTGISLPQYLSMGEADIYYLKRILTKVSESNRTTIDNLLKEKK